jgi:glycosyltransferase involved in cell wall biosynthesis
MRILHLSTTDISGGAARAAYRLHKGLQANDISSFMMVQFKESDDPSVIGPESNFAKGFSNIRISLDHFPKILFSKNRRTFFHLQWLPEKISNQIKKYGPDLVHLHWICRGFLNIKTLFRIKCPIVWTLHDMWPFTGGCHYSGDCEKYKKGCGKCPQIGSKKENDLSRWTWRRKSKYWNGVNMTIVAPSIWMKNCARESNLFKNYPVEVIPYGIDTKRYSRIDKKTARNYLGLPENSYLILFGAIQAISDRRKGFELLVSALRKFSKSQMGKKTELIIFGASKPQNPPDLRLKTTYIGKLNDFISLSFVYSACDLFVSPSIEDNLPNTIIEAMSCGTPCVAFNIGGFPDMIEHKKTGYLVEPFSIEDLVKGITWGLESSSNYQEFGVRIRKKVETDFDLRIIAQHYIELYERIIRKHSL